MFNMVGNREGNDVWFTDGTVPGTTAARLINHPREPGHIGYTTSAAGLVLGEAQVGLHGYELVAVDPARRQFHVVAEPAWSGGWSRPRNPRSDGVVTFFTRNGVADEWNYVRDVGPGSPSRAIATPGGGYDAANSAVLGDLLLMARTTTNEGKELWAMEGPTGNQWLIADLNPGTASSSPAGLVQFGSHIYFVATDVDHGKELFRSDGTTIDLVADLEPGSASSNPSSFVVVDDRLFFLATTVITGAELHVHDGVAPHLVTDLRSGGTGSGIQGLKAWPGKGVFFYADDGSGAGQEPYLSDGTALGTFRLADLESGTGTSWAGASHRSACEGDVCYFVARTTAAGLELFVSHGIANDVTLVEDFTPAGDTSFGALDRVGTDGAVIRVAQNGKNRVRVTNGGITGTQPMDFLEGSFARRPRAVWLSSRGDLFYSGHSALEGYELWVLPLQSTTPQLLMDISAGTGDSNPSQFREWNGLIFFTATSSALGTELWVTDGTSAGTHVVKDIAAGTGSSSPSYLAVLADGLYFSAAGVSGREPWKTDGTASGTVMLADLEAGSGSSNPFGFFSFEGQVLFAASTAATGSELFQYDPQLATASLLHDIVPGTTGSDITDLRKLGSRVLVTTGTTNANQLYAATLSPGSVESLGTFIWRLTFLCSTDTFYLLRGLDAASYGAWTTDGTLAGTRKLSLPAGHSLEAFPTCARLGSQIVLSGMVGYEMHLWTVDGMSDAVMPVDSAGQVDHASALTLLATSNPLVAFLLAPQPSGVMTLFRVFDTLGTVSLEPVMEFDDKYGTFLAGFDHNSVVGANNSFQSRGSMLMMVGAQRGEGVTRLWRY